MRIEDFIERYGARVVANALEPLISVERRLRIDRVLGARLSSVTVVLENLHDPHNGAAVIRSAEAMGLTTVHVVGKERFHYSKKVSIGCEKWMTVRRHGDFAAFAQGMRQKRVAIYGMVPGARRSLKEVDVRHPFAIAVGNEHEGLTEQARALCDHVVSIPMFGFTQSFNLSVSVAIALQACTERRREVLGAAGDLSDEDSQIFRAQWYAQSVRSATQVLACIVPKETHLCGTRDTNPTESGDIAHGS